MTCMNFERDMIHLAKNTLLQVVGESPSMARHKQHLGDARQAYHFHNTHLGESTGKPNEYVWEMVRQAYN